MTRIVAAALVAGGLATWLDPGGLRVAGLAFSALALAFAAWRIARGVRRHRQRHTLAALRRLSPAAFERAVGAWFARDGWAVEHRGRSGDHGIDVLAFHGSELVAVQCKRYAEGAAVSPAQLREFYGAAVAAGATRALLVTTGRVSEAALRWADGLRAMPPRLDVLAGNEVAAIAAGEIRVLPPERR